MLDPLLLFIVLYKCLTSDFLSSAFITNYVGGWAGQVLIIYGQEKVPHQEGRYVIVHRGYYTAAWRYEVYFQVVRTIFYEQEQRVSKILFLTMQK